MSALQTEIPGAAVLDLFAGSGALGLEALSRGAAHVTFVERAGVAFRALRENVRRLDAASEVTLVRGDALAFVEDAPEYYDIALADPPYGTGLAGALARRFQRTPFAGALWLEHRIDDEMPELPGVRTRRYGDTLITTIPADP